MSSSPAAWRTLQPGDRVRFVRLPGERVDTETAALYRHLIDQKTVVTVTEIDAWDRPWIEVECDEEDGWHSHSLRIDDDSWERVEA